MGRRGPLPEPISVRVLKGGGAGMGAAPVVGRPKCPSYLPPTAKREWRRIVPILERMGLLSEVDGSALEAYCVAYANMVEAQKWINEHGLTTVTKDGREVQSPAVGMMQKSLQIIKSFTTEFGLTPGARMRMSIPTTEPRDELDELIDNVQA